MPFSAAFDEEGGKLRELLESKDVLKVGYDGRADAAGLGGRLGRLGRGVEARTPTVISRAAPLLARHEFGPVRVQSFHALEEATEAWRAYGDSPLAGARRLRRVLTGYRHGDVAGDRA